MTSRAKKVTGVTTDKAAEDDLDMMWYRWYMNADDLVFATGSNPQVTSSGDSLVADPNDALGKPAQT